MEWHAMSLGSGQTTGDIYKLHGYAHRKTSRCPATWAVYRHADVLARGFADSIGDARTAAERVIGVILDGERA